MCCLEYIAIRQKMIQLVKYCYITEHHERLQIFAGYSHGLNHVTRAGLALSTDHGCALVDTAERLAEIFCTANKRNVNLVLLM